MHEMAMAEGILTVVLDAAGEEPVQSVRVKIGRLLAVVPESLQFSFQLLAADTSAAGAALDVQDVPALFQCRPCGVVSRLSGPPFLCEACGALEVEMASGDELMVEEVRLVNGLLFRPVPEDHKDVRTPLVQHLTRDHRGE